MNCSTADQVTTYTSGTFAGIDLFGRVIDQRWVTTGGSPTDKDRYQYGYDRNSNRQWRQNTVGSGLDELYAYDNLNRLITMKRGTLSGTSPVITSPANQQDWTLDPTGNWDEFITQTSGTPDLDQTRTQNTVNEITGISASVGTTWATPGYDAAGNMTTMPKPSSLGSSYTGIYDAWNRMVQVKNGGTTVATYRYDGRNRRVTVDTGVVRHFYFTNSWQNVEERLGSLTYADRQYVWGLRYIDELVCRDRVVGSASRSSGSSSSSAPALNERLYATQDANFNVTSLLDTSANVAERYTYTPYGVVTFCNASWADIGSSAKASTILYAGYKYDAETGLYCVRNRYYHQALGDWLTRDATEFQAGFNFFQYVSGNPSSNIDPFGLDEQDGLVDRRPLAARPNFCSICHGDLHGNYVDLTKPWFDPRTPSAEQLSLATAVGGCTPEKWPRPLGGTVAWAFTGRRDAKADEFIPAFMAFNQQAGVQWDCYRDCMKDILKAACSAGAAGGALPDLPYFPKVLSQPFIDPELYAGYRSTGMFGTVRTATALNAKQFGCEGLYERLMANRGYRLARWGPKRIMTQGGSGALRGGLVGFLSASIYCSIKCTISGM